jgi:hypothetical protein
MQKLNFIKGKTFDSRQEFINYKNEFKYLLENNTVIQMKDIDHHYETSCFAHSLYVSYYSYCICKKLSLDFKSAGRAGLLHDLFLYDWRRHDTHQGLHGFSHPKTALNNSMKICDLNKKEQDAIVKHMWPLTFKLPKYKESYVVSIVDKYCTLVEFARHCNILVKQTVSQKRLLQ